MLQYQRQHSILHIKYTGLSVSMVMKLDRLVGVTGNPFNELFVGKTGNQSVTIVM